MKSQLSKFTTYWNFSSVDSYFLCLIKESKQRKSSQKKPASRTSHALPGFLAGHRAEETNST
jgi:hypothetical protein